METFTTAICFKSESSDYYMFTSSEVTIENVLKELSNVWWFKSELPEVIEMVSNVVTVGDIIKLMDLLEDS